MKVLKEPLPGALLIAPRIFKDERGLFYEAFQAVKYNILGIPSFVQDNISQSHYGVLRGLHYQLPPYAQGKLISVVQGIIWDVIVDIRIDSSHFGQWYGTNLSSENCHQIYIPPGFAHGFLVLSEQAIVSYKCTQPYMPLYEKGIAWNDKELKINWPIAHPILSDRDKIHPTFSKVTNDVIS